VTRVIAAGILTVADVPVLEQDVPAGQNQTRPPMYEMGGLVQHRHARSASCLALLAPRADRRCQASVRGTRFPGSSHVLGVAPKVVPVSNGESIFTAQANTAQEPEVNYY
jgi:hypothetical protein